jgi:hypothetical protein
MLNNSSTPDPKMTRRIIDAGALGGSPLEFGELIAEKPRSGARW